MFSRLNLGDEEICQFFRSSAGFQASARASFISDAKVVRISCCQSRIFSNEREVRIIILILIDRKRKFEVRAETRVVLISMSALFLFDYFKHFETSRGSCILDEDSVKPDRTLHCDCIIRRGIAPPLKENAGFPSSSRAAHREATGQGQGTS